MKKLISNIIQRIKLFFQDLIDLRKHKEWNRGYHVALQDCHGLSIIEIEQGPEKKWSDCQRGDDYDMGYRFAISIMKLLILQNEPKKWLQNEKDKTRQNSVAKSSDENTVQTVPNSPTN